MDVPELILHLQQLVRDGLPEGHVVECGLGDPIEILGPLDDGGGREVLHEIDLT